MGDLESVQESGIFDREDYESKGSILDFSNIPDDEDYDYEVNNEQDAEGDNQELQEALQRV